LLDCTFALALAYLNRGSVRDAEYYLHQAEKLAEAVKSSAYAARAATGLAAIQSGLRAYEASLALLEGADKLAIDGVDAIAVSRAKGDVLAQQAAEEEAEELFIHAASAIDVLDAGFQTADSVQPSYVDAISALIAVHENRPRPSLSCRAF
jgi:predicted negative regulator of RcsB-dependent stress response